MTNIYRTDSDEEVLGDFVKDHEELYKTNDIFKDKGRKECLCSPTVATCLLKCARPCLTHKGHITASSCNPKSDRPQKR